MIDQPRLLEVVRTDGVGLARPRCSRRSSPARSARPRPRRPSGGRQQPPLRLGLRRRRPATLAGRRPSARAPSSRDRPDCRPRSPPLRRRGVACRTVAVAAVAAASRRGRRARLGRRARRRRSTPSSSRSPGARPPARERAGSGSSPSTAASSDGSTPTPAGHGRGRPRRGDRPADPAGDPHRRHTAGGRSRAQASAQLARAARKATDDRVAAFAVSVETAADARRGRRAGRPPRVQPRGRRRSSGAELVAGAGWFGLRSHPRPSGSISFGGPAVPDGSTTRCGASSDARERAATGPDRRRPRAPVGSGPHRLVPVPVGRPAARHGRHHRAWPAASTSPTYLAESAGWNVEKLVNVAAATGRHSIDETLELDRRADADGHPDAIVGGLPPTDSVAEAIELHRPPDGGVRASGACARWARSTVPLPPPTCCAPSRSAACCSS